MKLIILAAGYATRLYPLTLNQPKPLLPIAGRPMVDHVLKSMSSINSIDHVYLVTNEKFAPHFEDWVNNRNTSDFEVPITVINDHSTNDTNRLGAIGDLSLVISSQKIDDNLIVVAGDNLFSGDLGDYGRTCEEIQIPVLGVYDVGGLEEAAKYGVVEVNSEGRIVTFEEKPTKPKSTLIGIALYYYPKSVVPLIQQYIADGNNPDQPGRLIQWLYPQMPVHTWSVPGTWYDIGSKETLEEADLIFTENLV